MSGYRIGIQGYNRVQYGVLYTGLSMGNSCYTLPCIHGWHFCKSHQVAVPLWGQHASNLKRFGLLFD